LVFWTQRGGRPTLQGRNDLALHFLYGAYCEATTEQGVTAAVWKEQWDWANGKPYDCDDLAAGLAGAEWARRARADAGWLRDWAAFRKTLAANLPVFHYGTGHQTPQRLAQIHQDIRHSFNR